MLGRSMLKWVTLRDLQKQFDNKVRGFFLLCNVSIVGFTIYYLLSCCIFR
jgi:hypothetical protein